MPLNRTHLLLPVLVITVVGCSEIQVSQDTPPPETARKTGEPKQSFIVTSIMDSGPGSLREAIERANTSPGRDQILFDSEASLYQQPRQINLDSPLPVITDDLLIDGFISNMLWKASGVTLSGNRRFRIFEVADGTQAEIRHLTLAEGHADNGAGLLNRGETILEGVSLLNHSATSNGGAIYNSGRLWLINSTVAGNTAGETGGGLFNGPGHATVTNATLVWNTAKTGAALYNQGKFRMDNSILSSNRDAEDCVSTVPFDTPARKNIIGSHQGCGTPFSSINPELGQLGYYNGPTKTIPISGRSLAVNHGNNQSARDAMGKPLVWDQRGNGDPRFAAGITDIGAFEIQARTVLEVDSLDGEDKRWCTQAVDDCSLAGALHIAAASPRLSRISFLPEMFNGPVTLELPKELPEILHSVVLDASDVAEITISGTNGEWQKPLSDGRLVLKNVHFKN